MNLKPNPKKLEATALKFASAGLMLVFAWMFNQVMTEVRDSHLPHPDLRAGIVLVASVAGFGVSLESWLVAYDNEEEMED